MLKEFISTFNFDKIPIGPQAELLQDVELLNRYHDNNNKISITKKFTWSRGSYNKIHNTRNTILGGTKFSNVSEIFNKPERNRRSYYMMKYRRQLLSIDTELNRKRHDGSLWVEDVSVIDKIKEDAIDKVVKKFTDYVNYVKAVYNTDVEFHTIISNQSKHFMKYANKAYQKGNCFYILFNLNNIDKNNNYVSDRQQIYIIHSFDNLRMNIYKSEDTYPLAKIPCGNVVSIYRMSLNKLIHKVLKINTRWPDFWEKPECSFYYKPLIKGLKHPFIHYQRNPNSDYDDSHFIYREWDIDKWTINPNVHHPTTCYGSMNSLHGEGALDFVKYYEEAYTWLTTFRLGTTHPLNQINHLYYGDPSTNDEKINSFYFELIGIDSESCHSRLSDYNANVNKRNTICMTQCSDNIRNVCYGFKHDNWLIIKEKVSLDKVFKYKATQFMDIPEMMYAIDNTSEATNDNYYSNQSPDSSYQAAETIEEMLEWVRNNQQ